jgi:hypothetical protein
MTIQTKERPLSSTISFSSGETTRVEIDRDNLIRRITMLFSMNLDTPAAMTAATGADENGIKAIIKKIRLVMDADDNKFNVDATKWFFVEKIEKGTPQHEDTLAAPAAGSSNTIELLLSADFAQRRQDLSDVSALLDAPNKSSLFLEIDWGTVSDLFATVSDTTVLTTSVVRVALTEVFEDSNQEANAKLADTQFLDIREGVSQFNVTQAHSSFDDDIQEEQVNPTPANILTHCFNTVEDITSVSGVPTRANDIVTQLKVENVKGNGEKILQTRFDTLHFGNKAEYGIENLDTGVAYIDWVDQRRGGLANFVSEAIKFRFLTNAPVATETDAIELFTRYVSARQS